MRSAEGPSGGRSLSSGAWHLQGLSFHDARGESHEAFDRAGLDAVGVAFDLVTENIIRSSAAGTARGLHYQLAPQAQAKLVCVLQGKAQFFWLGLDGGRRRGPVPSLVLAPGAGLLYTPGDCAHGVVTMAPDTVFSLKLGGAIAPAARREISFRSPLLDFDFAVAPRWDLLSQRDRQAPASF